MEFPCHHGNKLLAEAKDCGKVLVDSQLEESGNTFLFFLKLKLVLVVLDMSSFLFLKPADIFKMFYFSFKVDVFFFSVTGTGAPKGLHILLQPKWKGRHEVSCLLDVCLLHKPFVVETYEPRSWIQPCWGFFSL